MPESDLPQLVLLPGLDGTGRLFEPICQQLSSRFNTHAVRYPDHKPVTRTELSAAIQSQLPAEAPYWLLGESFGGPLAIEMAAADNAGQCLGLILSATFVKNPHPVLSTLYPFIRRVPITPTIRSQIVRTMLGRYRTASLEQMFESATRNVQDGVFHARIQQIIETDATAAMQTVRERGLPVLSLTARDDWIVPPRASEVIAQICPGCERRSFDAPHVLLQAAPGETASAIAEFISQV